MKGQAKRVLIVIAGVIFLVLGLVGLALPFLQGFLFIFIGVVLLSISSVRIRTFVRSRTMHYPKAHRLIEKIEGWILGTIGPLDQEG